MNGFDRRLYVINIAGSNVGRPTRVGQPLGAMDIAATEENTLDFARVFALNDDRSLWRNSSGGIDSAWQKIGQPMLASKIACSREWIYCLGTNPRVLFRSRTGADDTWEPLGEIWATQEITAATSGVGGEEYLYALNNDGAVLPNYTLWRGEPT
jgi:hypothetical protein